MEKINEKIAAYLASQKVCMVSTAARHGLGVITPAPYRAAGLEIEFLLPRWADLVYYLEEDPETLIIVPQEPDPSDCWLEYRGFVKPVANPDWLAWTLAYPALQLVKPYPELYRVFRVTPRRLDLINQQRSWGARQTLELPAPLL